MIIVNDFNLEIFQLEILIGFPKFIVRSSLFEQYTMLQSQYRHGA
jgi:hypothetical protein